MKTTRSLLRLSTLAACTAGALLGTAAHAQTNQNTRSQYEAERAACMNGTSHQDRTTCLKEAGAALGEARKGNLTSAESYRRNALQRCGALPQSDREACVARVDGTGQITGSVEGGGVLRTYVQREVGVAPGSDAAPAGGYAAPQPMPQTMPQAAPRPAPRAGQPMPHGGAKPAPMPQTRSVTPTSPAPAAGTYAPPRPAAPVYENTQGNQGTYAPPPPPAPQGGYRAPMPQQPANSGGYYVPNQANPATNATPAPGTPLYQQGGATR